MIFNSLKFILFSPFVAIVSLLLGKSPKLRNLWLLLASYYFYINLKPIYGLLLLTITLITYFGGIKLERLPDLRGKKILLAVCLVLVFSFLFVFKYLNFINESISATLSFLGLRWEIPYLDILLPIGISFYTFQAAGYLIDIYRGKIRAEKNIITYALFVSFFPVILSGPIQKARDIIPQLKEKTYILYDNVVGGMRLMLWGYFMKLCVADRLGTYVDAVFNNLVQHNGASIAIASFFYTIQIYGDFAGYSLVAIGCAKVLGFKLPENFHRPYFSLSIKEFWKRWHIALSSWFMEYLYFPLGGSRVKYSRYLLNLMIVFLVSGLWHGAAWTFVFWGAIHGLLQIVEALRKKYFGEPVYRYWWSKPIKILFVFILVNFAWIFFRANSIGDAFYAIEKIITNIHPPFIHPMAMLFGVLSTLILFIKDYIDEYHPHICFLNSNNTAVSSLTFVFILTYILLFGILDSSQFIYFQF